MYKSAVYSFSYCCIAISARESIKSAKPTRSKAALTWPIMLRKSVRLDELIVHHISNTANQFKNETYSCSKDRRAPERPPERPPLWRDWDEAKRLRLLVILLHVFMSFHSMPYSAARSSIVRLPTSIFGWFCIFLWWKLPFNRIVFQPRYEGS